MILEFNNQTKFRVNQALFKKTIAAFASVTRQPLSAIVSLAVINDQEMRKWNLIYQSCQGTTDVLAFPAREGGKRGFNHLAEQRNFLGEIVISYPQAKKQAKARGHSLNQELVILFIHGLLHLIGYDHQNVSQTKRLERMTQKIYVHQL